MPAIECPEFYNKNCDEDCTVCAMLPCLSCPKNPYNATDGVCLAGWSILGWDCDDHPKSVN